MASPPCLERKRSRSLAPSSLLRTRLGVALPVQTLVHGAARRSAVPPERPADRQERDRRAGLGQAEPAVALVPEAAVQRRQRRAQPDGAARQQDVLDAGKERLPLR